MEKRVMWIVALAVVLLDRITKVLVQQWLPYGSSYDLGIFAFTHINNTGTLFGLAKGAGVLLLVFSMAVIVFIIVRHHTFAKWTLLWVGLILGGAIGNAIDRVLYGSVIDFIDFKVWPVFNVADSAISIAIVWLLVGEWRNARFK